MKIEEAEEIVNSTYMRVLRRDADDEGKQCYTEAIISGKIKEDALEEILKNSEEYKEKFANYQGAKIFGDGIDWDKEADRILREDKQIFYTQQSVIDRLFKYAPATGRVIDCGCNIGRFVEVFKNAGYEYVGIDQSEHAVVIAKKYHPDETFLAGFLWDMDFTEEFDVAFCNAVLQHNTLEEKKRIMPKIYNALKDKGVFVFAESTVEEPTKTQLTYNGWIELIESYGFTFLESWHKNELEIEDNYIFKVNHRRWV